MRLEYIEFAYKNTKDDYKLEDRFYKKDDFQSHMYTQIQR